MSFFRKPVDRHKGAKAFSKHAKRTNAMNLRMSYRGGIRL